jgi:drug/metabolite transporter (DMT)-like permease
MALEHVSTSFFFINYRIFSSILVLLIGLLFFSEELQIKDYLGMLVGFLVFFALLENTKESTIKKKIGLGLLYTLLAIVFISFTQYLLKGSSYYQIGLFDFLFFLALFGFLFASIINRKKITNKYVFFNNKNKIVSIACLQGVIAITLASVSGLAYSMGIMVIAYKITSFGLLIPIILSVIIYKEEMTKRKLVAIALALVSIALFL